MPSLKALRARIKSVKNTRQITKTMKMVAAAKVKKARTAVEGARPYAAKLAEVLANVATSGGTNPLLVGRRQAKTVTLVAVGTDRGLCGSLNAGLIKSAHAFVRQQQAAGKKVKLVAVGRKMRDAFRQTWPDALVATYTEMGRTVEFAHAQKIAGEALDAFNDGMTDEVHLLFAECTSMLAQTPKTHQLIPFASAQPTNEQRTTSNEQRAVIEYEPGPEAVLTQLLPLNLNMQVFSAMLETQASEHAARMTAMDNATRNAGEMIKKLNTTYNRTRQAAITKELIEIISGAEAL